jgi:general secretion pathway protein D
MQIKEQRMKKRVVWLTVAIATFGFYAPAETVITSPVGLSDESDVVLESAVKAIKETPADTVEAVGGAVSFVGDELRNTAHGVKSAFAAETPRETIRKDMLNAAAGAWDQSGVIIMRTYVVSLAVGLELAPAATDKDTTVDVRGFFTGIEFPEGATAYYRPEIHRLVVFNTPANLDAIEDVISRCHRAERDYKQVEIKAKFIEVSQGTLDQLGFSWNITEDTQLDGSWQVNSTDNPLSAGLRSAAGAFGGTLGAGSMVLTKSGWMPLSLTIQALEQSSDSDTLSAPSLTTMDGKKAEIWVGEDRAVPNSFEVKNADINIHIEHKNWKSELMGVHFEVTPEIKKDGLIRLKLNPKIVDLIGYDTFNICPSSTMLIYAGVNARISGVFPILKETVAGNTIDIWNQISATLGGIDPNTVGASTGGGVYRDSSRSLDYDADGLSLQAIDGQLPYFRVREIKTSVEVADGSTVGLGGLVYDRLETYKDKIPVLGSIPLIGRLFRSEGERSIKRNLMIFVSASQVANDGQRKSDVAINN